FNFRNTLERAVGKPGFAATVQATYNESARILNLLLENGTIVRWRALRITLAADVMTVAVEISPVIPVNFVTATVYLTAASFTVS
ncbi:MAG: hypothetical protein G01um101470_316, partial [Parcubacteria group bacterium Gr01-1014_70]